MIKTKTFGPFYNDCLIILIANACPREFTLEITSDLIRHCTEMSWASCASASVWKELDFGKEKNCSLSFVEHLFDKILIDITSSFLKTIVVD